MIKWNKVKYIDCMDEKEGLPSLPDKSIDLCLTDPPYNVNFTSGMTTYNNKVVRALKYLNQCRGSKLIKLEQCANHYDLTITKTRSNAKLDGVMS